MTKRVAVVSSKKDQNARYVLQALAKRSCEPTLVETAKIPEHQTLSWWDGEVRYAGVDLSEIRAWYLKSIYVSVPLADPGHFSARNFSTWHEQYVAERERYSLISSVLQGLESSERTLVNPVRSVDCHFFKTHQLQVLRRAKIPVPSSLATSDPESVYAFLERHTSVIYKPLAGGALVRRMSRVDMTEERMALLRNAPVLFQEEIVGQEFRAYVLDGEPVTAFHLPTEGVVDAREALRDVTPAELPHEVWELCLDAAKALDLVFAAVDLRQRDDGNWCLLECNPTPAIAFFEDPEDGIVINRLADFLAERA